jgi:glutamate synthase (NADPH/NADH) large chain
VQCLDADKAVNHWKQRGLDFSEVLYKPDVPHALYNCEKQRLEEELRGVLDMALIERARPALERGEAVVIDQAIRNTDRTLGAILGSEVYASGARGPARRYDHVRLRGSAEPGAFGRGLTFRRGRHQRLLWKGTSAQRLSWRPRASLIRGEYHHGERRLRRYQRQAYSRRGWSFCAKTGASAVVEGSVTTAAST